MSDCAGCDRLKETVRRLNRRCQSAEARVVQLESGYDELRTITNRYRARVEALEAAYHELIFAVVRKHQNESRHQTALRYIREQEEGGSIAAQASAPPAPSASTPRHESTNATVVDNAWETVAVDGRGTLYARCPRCGVRRVTEWCPPPCNTQSARYWLWASSGAKEIESANEAEVSGHIARASDMRRRTSASTPERTE